MVKKYLLVISKHPPDRWSEEQKKEWDKIEYYPFPKVNPNKRLMELVCFEVSDIVFKVKEFYQYCEKENANGYVSLQGEPSVCYHVYWTLFGDGINFVFPTFERVVVKTDDGRKLRKYKFVMWRY